MPVVPTYKSNVQEQGFPTVRNQNVAPIEAFGGGQAAKNPAADLFEKSIEVAKDIKKSYDQVQVQEYDTGINKLATDIQIKASSMKGKDAAGVQDFVDAEWQKGKAELDKNLHNEDQRFAGNATANNHYESLYKFAQAHTLDQLDKYDTESTAAHLDTLQRSAVLNLNNPEFVQKSLANQATSIQAYGERKGQDNETIKNNIIKNESKTHSLIVEQLLNNGQDTEAKNYYEANKERLTPDDLLKLEKPVHAGNLRNESRKVVSEIFSNNLDNVQALEKINAISDTELRDASLERYQKEMLQIRQAKKDISEKNTADLFNIIDQTKSLDSVVTDPRFVAASPEEKKSMRAYAKVVASGDEIPKNSGDYYYLLRLSYEDPKEFKDRDLSLFRSTVEPGQLSELMKLQKPAKGTSRDELTGGIRTKNAIVDGMLRELNIKPTPKPGSKEAKQANNFRRIVDEEIDVMEKATGKKATNADVESISKKIATEIVTEKRSFWFDKTKKEFELDVTDIPLVDLGQIDAALKARNVPISDSNRLFLYRRKLNGR